MGGARPQSPLKGREIHEAVGDVLPVYSNREKADKMASGSVVAEIEVSGASCRIGVSDSIPALLPPLPDRFSYRSRQNAGKRVGREWTAPAMEVDKVPVGFACMMGIEFEGRNPDRSAAQAPVLVVHRRHGRSCGPSRLPLQVGAGDHPRQDAQPAPDRLSLLGGAVWRFPLRRRPAIVGWSPRQLVPLSAVCRDTSGRGSRKRVCTIATRNKTYRSSAHRCGGLWVRLFSTPSAQYRGCTGLSLW